MIRLHPHAYFNEIDPGAAEWLRELIKAGLIAPGVVDERSILDVTADDLRGFVQCHFFAGIGGWSYALRLAGWPDDRPVWTGSPPCQPFSAAGCLEGRNDERHLAPHFVDLVGAARPGMLFGEQVASAAVFGKAAKRVRGNAVPPPEWAWLDDLSDRLEAAHYAIGASDFPSAGVGAPHIRQRTFFGAVDLQFAKGGMAEPPCTAVRRYTGDARTQTSARDREARPQDGNTAVSSGFACGLADSGGSGLEGLGWNGDGSCEPGRIVSGALGSASEAGTVGEGRSGPTNGFWSDADWLFCRDGKWRPVESAVLGLVDGLPGCVVPSGPFVPASYPLAQGGKDARRVMRLRGYGNAINPHAAAEFIQAFDAALAACGRSGAPAATIPEPPRQLSLFG